MKGLHGEILSVLPWLDHAPSPAPALVIHTQILFFRDSLVTSLTQCWPAYGLFGIFFPRKSYASIFLHIKDILNFTCCGEDREVTMTAVYLVVPKYQPLIAILDGNALPS